MAHPDPDGDHEPSQQAHSPTIPASTPAEPIRRHSGIRFTEGTTISPRSPMSKTRNPASDEITPIRNADGSGGRNYNSTGVDGAASSSDLPASKNVKPRSDDDEGKDETTSWYKRLVEKYGSVSLENKGSVARDHLALERTFLAWLRTSLAFASIGIAITQLFRLNTTIASRSQQYQAAIPFSPFVGQSIPVELLPYLSQGAASTLPSLGPTLLDQLLMLPAAGGPGSVVPANSPYHQTAYDEHAAARLRHVGKPLGATFLAISVVILFIGFHRYFESQHWIIRGKFPASRGSIFLVGFIAGALIIASLVVVLVIAPTAFTKT